jgi:hypothetical protein
MRQNDTFMGFVELNERAWGTDSYPGRPRLEEILRARVVAFWQHSRNRDPAYRVSIHENLLEIHEWASQTLIDSKNRMPEKRLTRLYVDKRRARIKGVRILLEEDK